jgi:tetratricopeptide (TPR) repeat protein
VRKDLGVRYVLKGSIRRSSDPVRIVTQLIEARSGVHLWAERYDRSLDDIFAVQDEIAMSVIGAIEPNLRKAEIERVKRKRPESLDAYDLVVRALPFVHKWMPDGATDAIPLLKKALEIEPGYTLAHALLARCFHFRFSRAGLRAEDRITAIHHARAAIIGDSDDATTLAIAALVIWFDERDSITALDLFDRALALSHSNVTALGNSAFVLAWMGKAEIAIERAQRAIQLCPFDNTISYMALSLAQIVNNQYEQARESARRAVESTPDLTFHMPYSLSPSFALDAKTRPRRKRAACWSWTRRSRRGTGRSPLDRCQRCSGLFQRHCGKRGYRSVDGCRNRVGYIVLNVW